MERQKGRAPIFRVVAYALMIVGVLLFVLTPLFLKSLDMDTDVVGILVVLAGLGVLIAGSIIRSVVRKTKGRPT